MLRANSVCLVVRFAAGVLGELLAENEDRVERRAQLMRHVGEELGLVLRGERELGGLFLEGAAGLLDLLVLALHLHVLFGKLAGLLGELLVGLLEFLLLRLQLRDGSASCDCWSRPSVRIVASSMVLSTTPMDCVSCSRKVPGG